MRSDLVDSCWRLFAAMLCAGALALAAGHARAATGPGAAGWAARRYVPILAPGATCSAQSDRFGLLILGQRGRPDRQLSVYALAGDGLPRAGEPAKIVLPRPSSLKSYDVHPLSVVFHPRLPLVYVWCDIAGPVSAAQQLEHLLIYRIESQSLQPAAAFAQGPEYASVHRTGTLALDPSGIRLFVPNVRTASGAASLGYFDLDESGMPKPVAVPAPGSLDGQGLEKFESRLRVTAAAIELDSALPVGSFGLVSPHPHAALFASAGGLGMWDLENRRGEFVLISVPGCATASSIGAHPDVPGIFGADAEASRNQIFHFQLAEGYPTLLPQILSIAESNGFRSAPVVLPGKVNRLAIGGVHRVFVVRLSGQGHFDGPAETLAVNNASVRTLAYSREHERLYVPVEKLP